MGNTQSRRMLEVMKYVADDHETSAEDYFESAMSYSAVTQNWASTTSIRTGTEYMYVADENDKSSSSSAVVESRDDRQAAVAAYVDVSAFETALPVNETECGNYDQHDSGIGTPISDIIADSGSSISDECAPDNNGSKDDEAVTTSGDVALSDDVLVLLADTEHFVADYFGDKNDKISSAVVGEFMEVEASATPFCRVSESRVISVVDAAADCSHDEKKNNDDGEIIPIAVVSPDSVSSTLYDAPLQNDASNDDAAAATCGAVSASGGVRIFDAEHFGDENNNNTDSWSPISRGFPDITPFDDDDTPDAAANPEQIRRLRRRRAAEKAATEKTMAVLAAEAGAPPPFVKYSHQIDYDVLDAEYVVDCYFWDVTRRMIEVDEMLVDAERTSAGPARHLLAVTMATMRRISGESDVIESDVRADADEIADRAGRSLDVLRRMKRGLLSISPATLMTTIADFLDGLNENVWMAEVSSVCVVDRSDTSMEIETIVEMSAWKVTKIQVYERQIKGSSKWMRYLYGNVHRGVIVTLEFAFRGCSEYLVHSLCDETKNFVGETVVVPITSVNTEYVWFKVNGWEKSDLKKTTMGDCVTACGWCYTLLYNNCEQAVRRIMRAAR